MIAAPAAFVVRLKAQAVAADEMPVQGIQFLSGLGGFQPQRELGNFNRTGVDVHAVKVVRQNGAVAVKLFQGIGIKTAQGQRQFPVVRREHIKRGHQKSAAAAGGVNDLDAFQPRLPCGPVKVFAYGYVLNLAFYAASGRHAIGRALAPFAFAGFIKAAYFGLLRLKIAAQGVLHDKAGNRIRRVNNTVFLALAGDAAAFAFNRRNAFCQVGDKRFGLGFGGFAQLFEFGDALLKNMSQHGNTHFRAKIVCRSSC